MSDKFLAIPDQMIGAILFPQEAVDWLAFGSLEQGARSSLSLDDQILCVHAAAGVLLMAMWGDDLPGYVRSPSIGNWYQIPSLFWGRQTSESMQSAMERPEIPHRLPGQPQPLDPRYGVDLAGYPHGLPANDIVHQIVAFRKAEVERYCRIANPVYQWKLKKHEGATLDLGPATDRSGGPGRPTSMHLILDELERRAAQGELCSTVAAEGRALAHWFATTPEFSGLARPRGKAVENAIRDRYRALRKTT